MAVLHSGREIGFGVPPTLEDISIQLGRIARFTGSLKVFYPVLAHTLVVHSIFPSIHSLLHDAQEIVTSDIPTPAKADSQRELERVYQKMIYQGYGISPPNTEETELLKTADAAALKAEAEALGNDTHKRLINWPAEMNTGRSDAVEAVKSLARLPYENYLDRNGVMVQYFLALLEAEINAYKKRK